MRPREDASLKDPAMETTTQDDAPKQARKDDHDGELAIVGRSVTVNKPIGEVYSVWKDPTRFPSFMVAVEAIEQHADGYHWTVRAPAGQTVNLVTRITEDQPNRLIAWESTPDSQIKTRGRVTFEEAPADRGTVVTAEIGYEPPGGDIGRLVAKLFAAEPNIQARHELKRFKMLLETGEITTGSSNLKQQGE
jgi:uncharacterized membrane protein